MSCNWRLLATIRIRIVRDHKEFESKERGTLHMVTPCTHSRIIETTGNGVVEGIQRRRIMDSLYRDSFDVFIIVDTKVNPRDGGGHGPCESGHNSPGSRLSDGRRWRCKSWVFVWGWWPGKQKRRDRPSRRCEKFHPTFFLPCDTAGDPRWLWLNPRDYYCRAAGRTLQLPLHR